jgi:hypothetical protein
LVYTTGGAFDLYGFHSTTNIIMKIVRNGIRTTILE